MLRRGLGSHERLLRGHDREIGHSAAGRNQKERQWVYATQGERVDAVMRYCMACTWREAGAPSRCANAFRRRDVKLVRSVILPGTGPHFTARSSRR